MRSAGPGERRGVDYTYIVIPSNYSEKVRMRNGLFEARVGGTFSQGEVVTSAISGFAPILRRSTSDPQHGLERRRRGHCISPNAYR